MTYVRAYDKAKRGFPAGVCACHPGSHPTPAGLDWVPSGRATPSRDSWVFRACSLRFWWVWFLRVGVRVRIDGWASRGGRIYGCMGEKKMVTFRLDVGLLGRVDAVRGPRSRTAVVVELLEGWVASRAGVVVAEGGVAVPESLDDVAAFAEAHGVPRSEARRRWAVARLVEPGAFVGTARELAEAPKRYRCPERVCDFSAPSARATCRVHGRRVVER